MNKRFISFASAILLMLVTCGCTGNKNAKAAGENNIVMKYYEQDIGKSMDAINPGLAQVNSQNQLIIHNIGTEKPEYLVLGEDGKVLRKIACDFAGEGNLFALDQQDTLYIVSTVAGETGLIQTIHVVNPQGELLRSIPLKEIRADHLEDYNKMITGIAVDHKGNIFLTRAQDSIVQLDSEGNEIKNFGDVLYLGTAKIDRENCLITYGIRTSDYKHVLQKFNVSTGSSLWNKTIELKKEKGIFSANDSVIQIDPIDNSIYLLSSTGIEKFDANGEPAGSVLDFKEHTILATGLLPMDLCVDSEKSFYVAAKTSQISSVLAEEGDTGAFGLFKYTLREVSEEDFVPLTLSVPSSSRLIEIAVSKFNQANPGYRIEVAEFGSGKEKNTDNERYVNTLNTELMSGMGPDILFAAALPYEKYIDRNSFVDLTQMMQNDKAFDSSRFFTNVFDAMAYDGKLYTMPVSIFVNAFVTNEKAIKDRNITFNPDTWTWEHFKMMMEELGPDTSIVPANTGNIIFTASCNRFIDTKNKKASFDTGEFLKMLELAKSLGHPGDDYSDDGIAPLFETAERGTVLFSPQSIGDFMMLSTTRALFKGEICIVNLPDMNGEQIRGTFSCNHSFAINSNSKHKEKAWDFIKTLLSEDIQTMDELKGFPVSKSGLQAKAERTAALLSTGSVMISVSTGSGEPIVPQALTEQEISQILAYVEKLTVYNHLDTKVAEIIQNETKAYFQGYKTADDVVKAIQNKMNIYLGE